MGTITTVPRTRGEPHPKKQRFGQGAEPEEASSSVNPRSYSLPPDAESTPTLLSVRQEEPSGIISGLDPPPNGDRYRGQIANQPIQAAPQSSRASCAENTTEEGRNNGLSNTPSTLQSLATRTVAMSSASQQAGTVSPTPTTIREEQDLLRRSSNGGPIIPSYTQFPSASSPTTPGTRLLPSAIPTSPILLLGSQQLPASLTQLIPNLPGTTPPLPSPSQLPLISPTGHIPPLTPPTGFEDLKNQIALLIAAQGGKIPNEGIPFPDLTMNIPLPGLKRLGNFEFNTGSGTLFKSGIGMISFDRAVIQQVENATVSFKLFGPKLVQPDDGTQASTDLALNTTTATLKIRGKEQGNFQDLELKETATNTYLTAKNLSGTGTPTGLIRDFKIAGLVTNLGADGSFYAVAGSGTAATKKEDTVSVDNLKATGDKRHFSVTTSSIRGTVPGVTKGELSKFGANDVAFTSIKLPNGDSQRHLTFGAGQLEPKKGSPIQIASAEVQATRHQDGTVEASAPKGSLRTSGGNSVEFENAQAKQQADKPILFIGADRLKLQLDLQSKELHNFGLKMADEVNKQLGGNLAVTFTGIGITVDPKTVKANFDVQNIQFDPQNAKSFIPQILLTANDGSVLQVTAVGERATQNYTVDATLMQNATLPVDGIGQLDIAKGSHFRFKIQKGKHGLTVRADELGTKLLGKGLTGQAGVQEASVDTDGKTMVINTVRNLSLQLSKKPDSKSNFRFDVGVLVKELHDAVVNAKLGNILKGEDAYLSLIPHKNPNGSVGLSAKFNFKLMLKDKRIADAQITLDDVHHFVASARLRKNTFSVLLGDADGKGWTKVSILGKAVQIEGHQVGASLSYRPFDGFSSIKSLFLSLSDEQRYDLTRGLYVSPFARRGGGSLGIHTPETSSFDAQFEVQIPYSQQLDLPTMESQDMKAFEVSARAGKRFEVGQGTVALSARVGLESSSAIKANFVGKIQVASIALGHSASFPTTPTFGLRAEYQGPHHSGQLEADIIAPPSAFDPGRKFIDDPALQGAALRLGGGLTLKDGVSVKVGGIVGVNENPKRYWAIGAEVSLSPPRKKKEK